MGSNLNFKNFGNEPPGAGGGGGANRTLPGNIPLTRQPSIYSLTFDEFQSSLGKDFGSMNMEELLKNIWSAEETQAMASTSAIGGGGGGGGGQEGLQRQGSLTLPRTLSQKTVDEVWKDISKPYSASKDLNSGGGGGSTMPHGQQTLGEVTLEEFLARAGVVREETQMAEKVNKDGYLGDLPASSGNNNAAGLAAAFQQASRVSNLMGNFGSDGVNQMQIQGSTLPLNVNGVRSSNHQQQQQPIFPKQPGFGYGTQIPLQSGQLSSPGIRGGIMGIGDQCLGSNTGLVQGGAVMPGSAMGLAGGLGGGAVAGGPGSPVTPLSSDGMGKSNGDTSSVSPSPYMFGGGLRGRKSSTVEKVADRRQRRMIKNRESAARSRARKQAYTMELEAEVAKLKEENQELRRKQAEMMEMQKNQAMEMMNVQGGPKKRLRRTQTGPW